MLKTIQAPMVWSSLNGLINVFKPAGVKVKQVKHSVLVNIAKG